MQQLGSPVLSCPFLPCPHCCCPLPRCLLMPAAAAFPVKKAAVNFAVSDIHTAMREGQRAVWAKLPAIKARRGRGPGLPGASAAQHRCSVDSNGSICALSPCSCSTVSVLLVVLLFALPAVGLRHRGLHRRAAAAGHPPDAAAAAAGEGGRAGGCGGPAVAPHSAGSGFVRSCVRNVVTVAAFAHS